MVLVHRITLQKWLIKSEETSHNLLHSQKHIK